MNDAAKHLDPQMGVDIHMYAVPPGPLPTPHIGQVMDPFDYIPGVSTVTINGVHRGIAGTAGTVVHIPMGIYAPGEGAGGGPQPDGEVIFMGSRTVTADGEPFSRSGMQVLDCNQPGMTNPSRRKPSPAQKTNSLPTGTNQAIPSHVKVGGEPVVKVQQGSKEEEKKNPLEGLLSGLNEQAMAIAEDTFDAWRRFLIGTLPSFILEAAALRADPVDIRDGSMVIESEDFKLPGRFALTWRRCYASRSSHVRGSCGHGWLTPADICLQLLEGGRAALAGPERVAYFAQRPQAGEQGKECLDFIDGARLTCEGSVWQVQFKDGLRMLFDDLPGDEAQERRLAISALADAHGNRWSFERVGGVLARIVESGVQGLLGRSISVTWNNNRIRSLTLHDPVTGERQELVSYCHDMTGHLLAAVDPEHAARTYQYKDHRIIMYTDRVGMSFHYAYDDNGRVSRNWGDGGLLDYRFEYDDLLSETRITDSLGHQRIVKLDVNRLPLCEIDPLNGVTFFEYDAFGRTLAVTDPGGLRTCFSYDERRNLCSITRPDGATLLQQRDGEDRLVMLQLFDGGRWSFAYDAFGNMTEGTDPLGAVTRYTYDEHGQFVCQVDARQATTHLRYDRHGHLAAIIDPLGHEIRYSHDARGHLTAATDALGKMTRYVHDGCGRLLSSTGADNACHRYSYDGEGQLVQYTDPVGARTCLQYVGIGRISRRIQPDGTSVEYLYNTEEQLVGLINEHDESYQLIRDPLGRLIEEVDYWGQSRRYRYDASGHLTGMTDALARDTTFSTDALGRIIGRRYPHAAYDQGYAQDRFAYDAQGRMLLMRSPDRCVTRRYDLRGQLLEETQDGFNVAFDYDPCGNRIRRTSATGNRVEYRYDLRGQLDGLTINDVPLMTMAHDAGMRRVNHRIGERLREDFEYDIAGRVVTQTLRGAVLEGAPSGYHHDAAGNLLSCEDGDQSEQFSLDAVGRLRSHVDRQGNLHAYLHDACGDRLAPERDATAATPDFTRTARCGGATYVFDRIGCLRQRHPGTSAGNVALTLGWDGCQRLISSEREGVRTEYGYDAIGRRAFKRTGTRTTWFYWDGDELLAEISSTGEMAAVPLGRQDSGATAAPLWPTADPPMQRAGARFATLAAPVAEQAREYVMHPQTLEPLLVLDALCSDVDKAMHYVQTRPNGAAVRLIDGTGSVAWQASLSGWGAAMVSADSCCANALRLLGQYLDEETGLHYNRHRYYDPVIGQFISQDPSGLASGVCNLYQYAVNVQSFVDPMGLFPQRRAAGAATGSAGTMPDTSSNPRFATRPEELNRLLGNSPGQGGSGSGGLGPSPLAGFNDFFFGNRGRVQFGYGIMRRLFFMGFGAVVSFPSSRDGLPGWAAGQFNGMVMGMLGMGMGILLFGLGTLFAALCREE